VAGVLSYSGPHRKTKSVILQKKLGRKGIEAFGRVKEIRGGETKCGEEGDVPNP
jgi:hypothetical protein